jgi:hypothetical protein
MTAVLLITPPGGLRSRCWVIIKCRAPAATQWGRGWALQACPAVDCVGMSWASAGRSKCPEQGAGQ